MTSDTDAAGILALAIAERWRLGHAVEDVELDARLARLIAENAHELALATIVRFLACQVKNDVITARQAASLVGDASADVIKSDATLGRRAHARAVAIMATLLNP